MTEESSKSTFKLSLTSMCILQTRFFINFLICKTCNDYLWLIATKFQLTLDLSKKYTLADLAVVVIGGNLQAGLENINKKWIWLETFHFLFYFFYQYLSVCKTSSLVRSFWFTEIQKRVIYRPELFVYFTNHNNLKTATNPNVIRKKTFLPSSKLLDLQNCLELKFGVWYLKYHPDKRVRNFKMSSFLI